MDLIAFLAIIHLSGSHVGELHSAVPEDEHLPCCRSIDDRHKEFFPGNVPIEKAQFIRCDNALRRIPTFIP